MTDYDHKHKTLDDAFGCKECSRPAGVCGVDHPKCTTGCSSWYASGYASVLSSAGSSKKSGFREILSELATLHDRKGADYDGPNRRAYENIRSSEQFDVPSWIGVAIRMNDKMTRVKTAARQALRGGAVALANESLVDSFNDIAIYAVIARVLLEEAQAGTSVGAVAKVV